MKEISIKGTARTATGKKASREIRKSNGVPVIFMVKQKTKKVFQ